MESMSTKYYSGWLHVWVVLLCSAQCALWATYEKQVVPNGKFKNGRYIAIVRQTKDQVAKLDVYISHKQRLTHRVCMSGSCVLQSVRTQLFG